MAQTQFIPHARVSPQQSSVPREGIGLFGVLALVIALLAGALTGGLILVKKSVDQSLDAKEKRLGEIHSQAELDSVVEVQKLQKRIERAQSILNAHVYSSQAFNFVELHTLDMINITSFSYSDGAIRVNAVAPGYVGFAQQIKYFKTLPEIEDFTFTAPQLNEDGSVSFGLDIRLAEKFLHTRPILEEPTEVIIPPEGGEEEFEEIEEL